MNHTIRYGAEASFEVDAPAQSVCYASRGIPLDDPAAAVAAALADPLDFPPILQATVPGDQIVLALGSSLPQRSAIVAGVVHTLLNGHAQPADITVLQTGSATSPQSDPRALLPDDVRQQMQLATHDPSDQDTLAYLAATRDGTPVYLNRKLCDADVVLPVGCGRLAGDSVYMPEGLFPAFSNDETRQDPGFGWSGHSMSDRDRAEEIAWLLGVQFAMHVIPGPGNSILHVLAGDAAAITRSGARLCQSAWQFQVSEPANLVVATIEGGPEHQTWDNFRRALHCAARVVADDGAIVICTELQCLPRKAVQRVAQQSGEHVPFADAESTLDAGFSSWLGATHERVRVYLLSDLTEDDIEPLSLGYIEHSNEINRLARQHDSFILLPNAHHAVVNVAD